MPTSTLVANEPSSASQTDARAGKYLTFQLSKEEFGIRVLKHAALELAGGAENGAACELAAEEIRCLAKRGARAAGGVPQDETKTF
jgi:hypothetical protein